LSESAQAVCGAAEGGSARDEILATAEARRAARRRDIYLDAGPDRDAAYRQLIRRIHHPHACHLTDVRLRSHSPRLDLRRSRTLRECVRPPPKPC